MKKCYKIRHFPIVFLKYFDFMFLPNKWLKSSSKNGRETSLKPCSNISQIKGKQKNSSKNHCPNSRQTSLVKIGKSSNLQSAQKQSAKQILDHFRPSGTANVLILSSRIETSEHVLCKCDGLTRTIFQILVLENLQSESYMREHLQRLIEIIKRAKLKLFLYD